MISVIIVTRNRQSKLRQCIQSILNNKKTKSEIIVIDQSDDVRITKKMLRAFRGHNIRYFNQPVLNVSSGKNLGLKRAKGSIIAFTDDDCIAHALWLRTIANFFSSHKNIDGMFGTTLAYRPQEHLHEHCPSTFIPAGYKEIRTPATHWEYIGVGNNMAFRSSTFQKHGRFKEWLSYGTKGGPSEDGELALRVVIKGSIVSGNPSAKIYHNRWMTDNESYDQQQVYYLANIVCYGYFYFQQFPFAKKTLKNEINGYLQNRQPSHSTGLHLLFQKMYRSLIIIKKLVLAWHLALTDPVIETTGT